MYYFFGLRLGAYCVYPTRTYASYIFECYVTAVETKDVVNPTDFYSTSPVFWLVCGATL